MASPARGLHPTSRRAEQRGGELGCAWQPSLPTFHPLAASLGDNREEFNVTQAGIV